MLVGVSLASPAWNNYYRQQPVVPKEPEAESAFLRAYERFIDGCAMNKDAVEDRVQNMQDAIESNEPATAMRVAFADTVQDCAESLYNQRVANLEEIRAMLDNNELVQKFVDRSVLYRDQFKTYVIKVNENGQIQMNKLREQILSRQNQIRVQLTAQLQILQKRVDDMEIAERLAKTPDVVLVSLRRTVSQINDKLAELNHE